MGSEYRVTSVADARNVNSTKAPPIELELERIQAMDFADREQGSLKRSSATNRKSVRWSASTESNRRSSPARINALSNIRAEHGRTQADYSSTESMYQEDQVELLMPVAYSPPSESESGSEHSTLSDDSWDSVKHSLRQLEGQYKLPDDDIDRTSKLADLTIDTNTYRGHTRNTSSISRHGRKDSRNADIYFTPTDYTQSQIFLSSPVHSPVLAPPQPEKDECLTPKASMSRPPSAIYVGNEPVPPPEDFAQKETLSITPTQLDQLVIALAKSQLIQRPVRKQWWNNDDIPDDDSIFSTSSASLPAMNTVSRIYSHPNQKILKIEDNTHTSNQSYAERPLPIPPVPFGGVSLLDSKIHGSPVRYTSRAYRQGSKILNIGSNTFLNIPYGTDVECTLRIEPASVFTENCKVMLQAVNQVVDRKTSKRAYLLVADVDVTDLFTKAALTEFAEAIGKAMDDITIQPTAPLSPEDTSIDWCALADEMQDTAETSLLISTAIDNFSRLDPSTCAMRTLALMSELERIKDQHMEFLIIVPTKYHANGMPSNMRMPWVSQRLYNDWYGKKDGAGFTSKGKDFQQSIVESVARKAMGREKFTIVLPWGKYRHFVDCVPLRNGDSREGDAWVCFVRGEFNFQT